MAEQPEQTKHTLAIEAEVARSPSGLLNLHFELATTEHDNRRIRICQHVGNQCFWVAIGPVIYTLPMDSFLQSLVGGVLAIEDTPATEGSQRS